MLFQSDTLHSQSYTSITCLHAAQYFGHCQTLKKYYTTKGHETAIHKLLPKDLENPIKENVASTSNEQGPNEGPIKDHSGTTLVSCTCDAHQELFDIFHTAFSVEQFEYLIFQIQKYCFTNEQGPKLKTVLDCCRLRFTNCQWDQLSHLLQQDQLNGGQFSIFAKMLDTSKQKLVFMHAGGGTGKTFVTCKNFQELAYQDKIC